MVQTIMVTGAASGIGLACTKKLLDKGNRILAFDPKEEQMRAELPNDERIIFFGGDVSKPEDCKEAVFQTNKKFGELNALIHWGATHSSKKWDELDAGEFNFVMSVNVTGSFLISQAAAVLQGVTGGEGQGGPAYVSSKGAIIALTRSLSRSLAPKIRCNAVSPGLTETAMIAGYTEKKRKAMAERFPMGRFGTAEEIANAGIFLISKKASFITGEVIQVNGGSNFN